MGNHEINFQSDKEHIEMIHGKTYMAAVSPWFFTVRDYFALLFFSKNLVLSSITDLTRGIRTGFIAGMIGSTINVGRCW